MARKSTPAKKRKPIGKKATTKAKKLTKAEQSAQKQMWAVVLFAVGILLGFLTWIEGSKIWNFGHRLLFGLCGWGAYFVAPLCIYIAFMAAKDKPMKIIKGKLWQSGVLLLFISGSIGVFQGLPETDSVLDSVVALFENGVDKIGGGMLSIVFAGPLSLVGGPPIPQILILLGLFVFVMLVTGSTLMTLYYGLTIPVKNVGDAYSQKVEERKTMDEERALERLAYEQTVLKDEAKSKKPTGAFTFKGDTSSLSKFDIDIDISKDSSPEEFPTDKIPLEPITKDLKGASLSDPLPASASQSFSVPQSTDSFSPPEFSDTSMEQENVGDEQRTDDSTDVLRNNPHVYSTPTYPTFTTPSAQRVEETRVKPDVVDPLKNFGVDSPVEYVTLEHKIIKPEDLVEQPEVRPHPLEAAITEAQEEDVLRMVQDYLNTPSTLPSEDLEEELFQEEPIEIETFRADITQPAYGMYDDELSEDATLEDLDNITEDLEGDIFEENIINGEEIDWGDQGEDPSFTEELPVVPLAPSFSPTSKSPTKSPYENRGKSNPKTEKKIKTKKPQETSSKKIPNDSERYQLPPITLLQAPEPKSKKDDSAELRDNADKLVATLQSFGVETKVINISKGPAVTRYELQPSPGVKISRITGLADDIALNLAAAGIRIEAPIPNKPAVGIEVPNKDISIVRIRELIDSRTFQESNANIAMALGKDITGNLAVGDIAKMPHTLIAGATGSGKSVCINSLIMSILYKYSPDEVKLLMIDPKVVELGVYNGIPHLLVPVVTDPKKASGALSWAVKEMLKRYQLFAENSVRDIGGYNRSIEDNDEAEHMPQIVIIIDELADLMVAAPTEVEDSIQRLAQMARAAGMHLVIATQRPSVDVITGVIKANIPSRIAFAVSSQVDSRTILDFGGAEKLLGRGDMLFYPSGAAKPTRIQGCFVTDEEVERVVDFVKTDKSASYDEDIADEIDRLSSPEPTGGGPLGGGFDDEDELIPYAIETIVDAGQASTSLLQRRLKVGYARAARMIDQLEDRGIVGPFEGSKPRELMITKDQHIEMKLAGLDQPNAGGEIPEQQSLDTSRDED